MARLRLALLMLIIFGAAARLMALTCSGPSPDVVGAKPTVRKGFGREPGTTNEKPTKTQQARCGRFSLVCGSAFNQLPRFAKTAFQQRFPRTGRA
jgi:hypothetical protein